MKKLLLLAFISIVVLFMSFAWGCKSRQSPAASSPQDTATITRTRTPIYSSTITCTVTVTPTITATVMGRWFFDGSLEGWERTTATYTAFTDAYYTTANYNSAPGSAGIDCNFTGTGGAATQTGRFFIDLSVQPVDLSGRNGLEMYVYIPAGMTDNTPRYNFNVYMRTDGGWVQVYGAGLYSAGGWTGWSMPYVTSSSFPSGSTILTGLMIEVVKPDGAADFSGTMYIDSIFFN
jgi:hypothetical protein